MESAHNFIEEAAEAIRQVIKAFKFFRGIDSPLNEFLKEIELMLESGAARKSIEDKDAKIKAVSHCNCGNENRHTNNETNTPIPTLNNTQSIIYSYSHLPDNESHGVNNVVTEDEKSLPDQVFGIDLLLESILQNLAASDLKTCRCVNLPWNSIATKLLLKNEALNISFKFDKRRHEFVPNSSNHNLNLNMLTELIENKKNPEIIPFKFPCNNFSFTDGNLTNTSLQIFLSNYGFIISHLYLELTDEDQANEAKFMRDFKKLLTEDAPNLEKLEIGMFPELWEDDDDLTQLFPEPADYNICGKIGNGKPKSNCFLPKLKSINFFTPAPVKIFRDIITAASNLESISMNEDCDYDNCDAMLTTLMELNKINLLTSLEITLQSGNLKLYNKLLRKKLYLKKLTIYFEHTSSSSNNSSKVTQVVTKLLNSCSHSLEEFHTPPLGHCFPIEIPVMPKLKYIVISKYGVSSEKVFPSGLQLSHIFPSLKSLRSDRVYVQPEFSGLNWDSVFGAKSKDKLLTVQNMYFEHGPPLEWITNFANIFPNLTTVRIGLIYDFPHTSLALWKLSALTSLECTIWVDKQKKWNVFPDLEAGFTGFSRETCLRLYNTSREVDLSAVESLRERGSILDAKCLKKMHLVIRDLRNAKQYLSHVTGLFAFKLCPQLAITISYEANTPENRTGLLNGLSPIFPYVTSVTKASRDVSMLTLS